MVRVKFSKRIKFNDKFYDAYDAFDVPEEDVGYLLQQGASIVKIEENELDFNSPFIDEIEDDVNLSDDIIREELEKIQSKRKKK